MNINPKTPLKLDGRTLEGGGQLVRNALVLCAITGQEIIINNIRQNRTGKTGLKTSHAAAVNFLADVSGSEVSGGEVGSRSLRFSPAPRSMEAFREDEEKEGDTTAQIHSKYYRDDYRISLPTAGSVFLILQAVYPYLMLSGMERDSIRLHLRGGTNVSFSPSYDYIAQVLIPNFERLGLPRLAVRLHRRGWSTGPSRLGEVTVFIHPVGSSSSRGQREVAGDDHPHCYDYFPIINMNNHRRGMITRIDITVLAPDYPVKANQDQTQNQTQRNNNSHDSSFTIRNFIEKETRKSLQHTLKTLPISIFSRDHDDTDTTAKTTRAEVTVPIITHTSEPTNHRSNVYLLIVAHTSTGFRIARDTLMDGHHSDNRRSRRGRRGRGQAKNNNKNNDDDDDDDANDLKLATGKLVDQCVNSFVEELFDERFDGANVPRTGTTPATTTGKNRERGETKKQRKPCVDVFMRDQIVLFEALSRVMNRRDGDGEGNTTTTTTTTTTTSGNDDKVDVDGEDERYWSLHTRTAMWVCRQILGVSF